MPLLLFPLLGFALGAFLGNASERAAAEQQGIRARAFRAVLLLSALVVAPELAYYAAFHCDWAYLYTAPGGSIPSAIDLMLVLVGSTAPVAGFVAIGLGPRSPTRTALSVAAPLFALLAALGVFHLRLSVSASYLQFHGGFGVTPIFGSSLGMAVIWMNFVLGVGTWFAWWLIREAARGA